MNEIARLRAELDAAVAAFDGEAVRTIAEGLATGIGQRVAEHPDAFLAALGRSLDTFDDERTASLCAALVAHLREREAPYPPDRAVDVLARLRRKRRVHEVLNVADALLQYGCDTNRVRRAYAQALLDAGHLSAGIDVLERLETRCLESADERELAEARGLLGRAWKQIYCTGAGSPSRRRAALERAERHYAGEFRRDPQLLWHGINSVALQCRARRDALAGYVPSTGTIAGPEIAALVGATDSGADGDADDVPLADRAPDMDVWTQATLAEACLAEDDFAGALRWVGRYIERGEDGRAPADAFEIASTLRQFEEVWQLDIGNLEHARILEVLRSALLDREGGSVSLADARAEAGAIDAMLEDAAFEQILGRDRFRNLRWYRTGIERARAVCKLVGAHGEGFGTGFLVRAEDLGLRHASDWVVLTNAHVVSESAEERAGTPAAVPPDEASLRFEASDEPERHYAITRVLASSPRRELDFSVLALDGEGDFPEPIRIARRLPLLESEQRVYVIGHPRGGDIAFSLNDNLLIDHEAPKVHYRSPTEGGSSGSPLFNQNWELIGLHHAGGKDMPKLNGRVGRYPANEGLWIQSIREAIVSGPG